MAKEKMINYQGRINTRIYELEDGSMDNSIRVIEYGEKISRVTEVDKDTGEVYRSLCCKTDGNINDDADRMWIRKQLIGGSGRIRQESLHCETGWDRYDALDEKMTGSRL